MSQVHLSKEVIKYFFRTSSIFKILLRLFLASSLLEAKCTFQNNYREVQNKAERCIKWIHLLEIAHESVTIYIWTISGVVETYVDDYYRRVNCNTFYLCLLQRRLFVRKIKFQIKCFCLMKIPLYDYPPYRH